jgi:hypothetical protein
MIKILAAALIAGASVSASAVTITFDTAVGAYTPTPGVIQNVKTEFSSLGVVFRDTTDPTRGVTLGQCGPGDGPVSLFGFGNDFAGCGNTRPNFDILFVDPSNGSSPGTTDFFSLHNYDGLVRADAYGVSDDLLGSIELFEGDLVLSYAGIRRVHLLSLDGDPTTLDTLTFNDVTAVGGVPEPASWAMMIAGFGLIGAATRRRRAAAFG